MAKTSLIDGIPVFEALVTDEDCGMVRISLVDLPAVMSDWQAFAGQQPQRFSIADEDQRLIRGVIMRADFPIYRRDASGEYYLIYRAETIRSMAEKYLAENRANRVDLMHDGDEVRGVQMVQWFIKDTEKGITPAGYEEIADGSLFAEFHVTDDAIWAAVKDGTFKGFSLEGFFDVAPDMRQQDIDEIVRELEGKFSAADITNKQDIMSKITKTFDRLRELLEADKRTEQTFGAVTTDKGILEWDGEGDLEAGMPVFISAEDGTREAAADGEYTTEDQKVIRVENGIVAEIRDPEADVASEPEAEEKAEEPAPEVEAAAVETSNGILEWDGEEDLEAGREVYVRDEEGNRIPAPDGEYVIEDGKTIRVEEGRVAEIIDPAAEVAPEPEAEAEIAQLRARIAELEAEVESLRKQPMAKTAHEEVRDFTSFKKTGNKSADRLSQLIEASRK